MAESGGEDSWTAPDKFQHVLFCFSLTLTFSLLAARTAYPFLRRRPVTVGSVISLSAGAAKEVADHFGYFHSAGASAKDAVADAAGVLLACFALSVFRFVFSKRKFDDGGVIRGVALV